MRSAVRHDMPVPRHEGGIKRFSRTTLEAFLLVYSLYARTTSWPPPQPPTSSLFHCGPHRRPCMSRATLGLKDLELPPHHRAVPSATRTATQYNVTFSYALPYLCQTLLVRALHVPLPRTGTPFPYRPGISAPTPSSPPPRHPFLRFILL